ncbi:MAG: hypothetical protein OEP48_16385 [Betaproteobacteria bacterium]|nr:hypothetical protein [Betaproteobacteria bacterium]
MADLETQLVLAVRLGYPKSGAQSFAQATRVGKLVRSLRRALKSEAN